MNLPDLFVSLPTTRAERWHALAELTRAWFGPLTPEDGYPKDGIRDAEARLGFALPAALREASLRFGRTMELACAIETISAAALARVARRAARLHGEQRG